VQLCICELVILVTGSCCCIGSLHQHLIEHLNAEIVLGTITDVSVSLEWLRSTFLYIRVNKNPKHYGRFSAFSTSFAVSVFVN